jgi:hypothetical protein
MLCAVLCYAVCCVLQDIVTASPHFSVEGFIPRLRDYLRVTNPYKRQFLISWVSWPGCSCTHGPLTPPQRQPGAAQLVPVTYVC